VQQRGRISVDSVAEAEKSEEAAASPAATRSAPRRSRAASKSPRSGAGWFVVQSAAYSTLKSRNSALCHHLSAPKWADFRCNRASPRDLTSRATLGALHSPRWVRWRAATHPYYLAGDSYAGCEKKIPVLPQPSRWRWLVASRPRLAAFPRWRRLGTPRAVGRCTRKRAPASAGDFKRDRCGRTRTPGRPIGDMAVGSNATPAQHQRCR